MSIGELFILGFFGEAVPDWLRDFAARFGLGGVILFDYSVRARQHDKNIESPEQVRALCAEIARLPSAPLVFIDQEGGLVRRLKDTRGFAPLPSAKEFNILKWGEARYPRCQPPRTADARHKLQLCPGHRRRLQSGQSQHRPFERGESLIRAMTHSISPAANVNFGHVKPAISGLMTATA